MKKIDTSNLKNDFGGMNTIVKAHGKFKPVLEKLFVVAALTATMIVPSEAKANGIGGIVKFVADLSVHYMNSDENTKEATLEQRDVSVTSDNTKDIRTPTGSENINQNYLNKIVKEKNKALDM